MKVAKADCGKLGDEKFFVAHFVLTSRYRKLLPNHRLRSVDQPPVSQV